MVPGVDCVLSKLHGSSKKAEIKGKHRITGKHNKHNKPKPKEISKFFFFPGLTNVSYGCIFP